MAEHGNVQDLLPNEVLNRTSFHFQPQRNWLNDPNAPMYYKGFYHLFYQYNPLAPEFSRKIIWGHSVSQDMVNWIQLQPALFPSQSFDRNSCWSGSATILPDGKPVILYTGLDEPDRHQVTVLAEPKDVSDPLLREWVKPKHNPVMLPPDDVPYYCFRDPTTAWQGQDGRWRVLIGAKHKDTERGMAILYHSDDFIQWTSHPFPLLSSQVKEMWECLDFFPVSLTGKEGVETSVNNASVKHVLKVSFEEKIGGKDCYVIGTYSSETEQFSADSEITNTSADLRYDYGMFYASKAFFDSAKNRRINWGWVVETDSKEDHFQKGWAGLMSLPREMWVDRSGKRLMQWPIEEINHLRTRHVTSDRRHFESGSRFEILGITAAQADVEVTFDLPVLEDNPQTLNSDKVEDKLLFNRDNSDGCLYGPFGLLALVSQDLSEQTAIFFKIIRCGNGYAVIMGSDEQKSSLRDNVHKFTHGTFLDIDPRHEMISLRCLVDHSIIESYGAGGRNVITSRVYPKLAIGEAAKLYVFNDGTKGVTMSSMEAWSMRNAQINSNAI
ncbi:PREDICTED: beta-fructofuranosidase, insoluble isoenzyme CWINV6-like [Camelina sativa]|uniref:Beta-fructofuranosidase, insoluble isoenzyme CWINV6-like n=1 Tax=Camelina sativa TaxID=90675 RepID=A0ABM0VA93_CAMSA|nr:PREDICTED: beta-fructofuranosidase, insoluble isoenzyme CWINV6-like [Camelina sativa]